MQHNSFKTLYYYGQANNTARKYFRAIKGIYVKFWERKEKSKSFIFLLKDIDANLLTLSDKMLIFS